MMEQYQEKIDQMIENKHLLKHDFYQAWTRGELSLECLREYATQYYHHVKAFPTYLSALHSHTENMDTRKVILKNLVEEEAGSPNHPDMWKAFACRLGADTNEVDNLKPLTSMKNLVETFKTHCHHGSVAAGLAALYTYESQIPAVSESKIDGLRDFYGLTQPKDWIYFSVHIEADKEHAAAERDLLSQYVTSENWEEVQHSVGNILDALNAFLTELCHKYDIPCAA